MPANAVHGNNEKEKKNQQIKFITTVVIIIIHKLLFTLVFCSRTSGYGEFFFNVIYSSRIYFIAVLVQNAVPRNRTNKTGTVHILRVLFFFLSFFPSSCIMYCYCVVVRVHLHLLRRKSNTTITHTDRTRAGYVIFLYLEYFFKCLFFESIQRCV